MSNIVPLMIGGGVLAYFMTKKKKATSSSSNEPITSQIGSKDYGYEIINCNKVIIYDEKKAFQFAYTLGAATGMKILSVKGYQYSVDSLLTGDCLEKNIEGMNKEQAAPIVKKLFKDKKTIKFIYNLYRHFNSGLVGVVDIEEELALERLSKMKSVIEEMGFDVSDLQVSLIVI